MFLTTQGYLMQGDVYEHRRIAERALGRPLQKKEVVHHIDYDKTNNNPSNLLICTPELHRIIHARTDCLNAGFDPNRYKLCNFHKTYEPLESFSPNKAGYLGLHGSCRLGTNLYRKQKGLNCDKFDWRACLHQQYRRAFKSGKISNLEGRCL